MSVGQRSSFEKWWLRWGVPCVAAGDLGDTGGACRVGANKAEDPSNHKSNEMFGCIGSIFFGAAIPM